MGKLTETERLALLGRGDLTAEQRLALQPAWTLEIDRALNHALERPLPEGWSYENAGGNLYDARGPGGWVALMPPYQSAVTGQESTRTRIEVRGGEYRNETVDTWQEAVVRFYAWIAHLARVPALSEAEALALVKHQARSQRVHVLGYERRADNTLLVRYRVGEHAREHATRVGRTRTGVFELREDEGTGRELRANPWTPTAPSRPDAYTLDIDDDGQIVMVYQGEVYRLGTDVRGAVAAAAELADEGERGEVARRMYRQAGRFVRENPCGCEGPRPNGVYDPNILKAVVLAGGPGSGKSHVASELFAFPRGHAVGLTSAYGLKLVNGDPAFELFLHRRGIDPASLATMSPQEFAELTEGPDSPRGQAKRVRDAQMRAWEEGRLGLVLDGTGDDYPKIARQREHLRQLGYDTYMVFVNTTLEVAQERNAKRARKLPAHLVAAVWKDVQANLGAFQSLFGARNFVLVDNTRHGPVPAAVAHAVAGFLRRPVENAIGRAWVQNELAAKRRANSPLRANHHLSPGAIVAHGAYGEGTVARALAGDSYVVRFTHGERTVDGGDLELA